MPLNRYYSDSDLTIGTTQVLTEAENHHLLRVARVACGSSVELVNGRGVLAEAVVGQLVGKSKLAQLQVTAAKQELAPSNPLLLVQALPRAPRLDLIIEKATELGATQIVLFPGDRSERKELSQQQWQRCHSLTVSALKQCGRLFLPQLLWWPELAHWPSFAGVGYFGDVKTEAVPLWQALQAALPKHIALGFCVGPEAGFSIREEGLMIDYGWRGVKLHGSILRADTAPLVALALLSHHLLLQKEG